MDELSEADIRDILRITASDGCKAAANPVTPETESEQEEAEMCPYCGPTCYGGGAHNARAEDRLFYDPTPEPTQPAPIPDDLRRCKYCSGPPDHKCGKGYSCGDCCGMHGSLSHEDGEAYAWVKDIVERFNERIARLTAELAEAKEAISIVAAANSYLWQLFTKAGLAALKAENAKLQEKLKKLVPFTEADLCWCQPFDAPAHPMCPMHGEWLAAHDAEVRCKALEEAAADVENYSAYSSHEDIAKVHAKWIRALIGGTQ